jgi:hypothetical protein
LPRGQSKKRSSAFFCLRVYEGFRELDSRKRHTSVRRLGGQWHEPWPSPRSPGRNCPGAFERGASRTEGPLSSPASIEPYDARLISGPRRETRTARESRGDPKNGGFLRTPGAAFATRWRGMNVLPSASDLCADSDIFVKRSSLSANYLGDNGDNRFSSRNRRFSQYFAEIGNCSAGNSEMMVWPLSVTTTSSSMRAAE